VAQSVRDYGQNLPLRAMQIFGGVGMGPQVEQLRRGVDIVVATPGRLLDHAGQGSIDLSAVELLVLDEADRMLDMGFIHDIRRILRLLPNQRQNLLFSATYSREIEQLANGLLRDPERIAVAPRNTAAETVNQLVHPVARTQKRALLSRLIHSGGWSQVLIFTRTKHGANRLAQQLEQDGITAAAIHGNKSQGARTRALAGFKDGDVRALVATDIAARGLDIDRLPHVVNFDLPQVPEDYVHRIGRTGRAGADGTAVSLVAPDERPLLTAIERMLGRRVASQVIDGFDCVDPVAEAAEVAKAQQRRGNQPRVAKHHPRPRAAGRDGQQHARERTGSGRARVSAGTGRRRPSA